MNGKRKRKIASFYMKGNYIYESFISDGIIYYSTKFISDNREKYYAISVDKFKQKSISKKSFFKQYNTTKIYTSNKKNYYTRILVKDKSFMSRENNYRNAYSAYVIKDNKYTWTLVKTNGQKVKKLYELEKCKS